MSNNPTPLLPYGYEYHAHPGHSSSEDEGEDEDRNVIQSKATSTTRLTPSEETMVDQGSASSSSSRAAHGLGQPRPSSTQDNSSHSQPGPSSAGGKTTLVQFQPLWTPKEQARKGGSNVRPLLLGVPMVASPIAQSPPELKRPGTSDSEDSRTSVQSFSEIAGSERWDSAQSRKKSLGEMAFKSPIIGTQSRVELPKLDPHQVIGYRAQMTHDWGIYWYLPTLMVVAFLAGVIGTVGHHSFYASLHGHKSVNPLLMVRVGTAFAFFVKTCLTGAVVIAYKQRIWVSLRRRAMKLTTIDALFGVIEDPLFFITDPEIFMTAKIATLLAVASWLIPIASVLSPSSLTSEVSELAWHSQCEVPTLDFARENNYDYRTVTEFFGSSLAFYNHTNPKDTTTDLSYDMPSFINQRLSSQSIFNQGATGPVDSPCRSINCTYSIIFDGPGYKCERIEDGDELYARAPFKRSKLAPDGDLFYLSDVDQGDFKKPNLRPTDPTLDPNWIVGTFHFEPELWLGYTVNTTERVENDNPWKERVNGTLVNRWTHKLEAIMFHCEHYHVNYEVKVFYINGVQHVNVTRVYYLEPVMTTKYGEKPEPRRFMRPGEKGYKLMAVYHALGAQMRSYLRGYIKYANNRPKATPPVTTTQLSMTNIVDQRTAFPKNDLDHRVQKFYEDIIFTLWSTPELVVGKKENVTCVLTRYENLFFYHSRNLWTGYSVVIIITLIAIGVGTLSLRTNGIACDTLFSRIMVTTRNPTLDHLSRGACLGADPFPKEIERTRLRFGVLKERESEAVGMTGLGLTTIGMSSSGRKPEHCSFGTADETTEIVNGRLYAGLSYIKGEKEGYGAYTGHLDHRQGGIVDEKSENINDEDEGCYSSCDEGLGKEAEEIPLLRL